MGSITEARIPEVTASAGAKCSFTGTGAVLVTANTGAIGSITGARIPEVTARAGDTPSRSGEGAVSKTAGTWRHRHDHWSSPSIGDSRSWSPVLTHRNRLCVGACNDGRHRLDHWSSASMGDSRCYCCTDGLHNGTRSVMALVSLSLSQSKVRFVSAALNTFLHIIVTSWSTQSRCSVLDKIIQGTGSKIAIWAN